MDRARPAPAAAADGARRFRPRHPPIFKASCIKCHGAEGKPKGQFRLDSRGRVRAARREGDPAREGAESLLYKLLVDADEDARMPQKAPRLPRRRSSSIKRWIDEGAAWPEDAAGATSPTGRSVRSRAAGPGGPAHPIDAFILAKLKEKGFTPSPEADRRTLLAASRTTSSACRRRPRRWTRTSRTSRPVDRLLASPRYGERWARHWLDAIHYADTHGHDQDRPRNNSWPYRDYVIRALNEDKPWARFIEEQLAGDVLLPETAGARRDRLHRRRPVGRELADAHHGRHRRQEDRPEPRPRRHADRDDVVVHERHRPVRALPQPQVRSDLAGGVLRAPVLLRRRGSGQPAFDDDPAINRRRQELLRRKTEVALRKFDLDAGVEREVAEWEKSRTDAEIWTVVDAETDRVEGRLDARQAAGRLDPLDGRAARDRHLHHHGPLAAPARGGGTARGPHGRRSSLQGARASGQRQLPPVGVPRRGRGEAGRAPPSHADFNQAGWTIAHALDGKPETAWGIYPEVGKVHTAVFELKQPIEAEEITFILEQVHGRHHLIHRPRLSVSSAPIPEPVPATIAKILATASRSTEQRTELAAFVLEKRLQRELDALPKPRQVYAAANDFTPEAKFTPARAPRPIFLLKRGDVTRPAEPALPGGLACVGVPLAVADPSDEGARRAALATWIADPRNILTWRSVVNRVWHHHFGRGIVDSPNDLGRMGATPTHPELLDWLAVWFRDHGGSLKTLHRLIVTSATYRQTSDRTEFAKADASNLHLWRMNRLRLDAEQVRDSVLQLSGKLDLRMGGPSVKQFHYEDPNPGVTPKVDYGRYDVDHPDNYRRSIYRWIFRTLPDPFMETLDCPDASQLTGARNVSVTPLQAMAVMNNRFVVRQSEHLAARAATAESAGG
jgi:hypothetical protein